MSGGSVSSVQPSFSSVNQIGQNQRNVPVESSSRGNVQPMTNAQRAESKAISAQLEHLLNRISKRSTVGVEMSDLRAAFAQVPPESLKLLKDVEETARTAHHQLALISNFSGEEIAQAVKLSKGDVTWKGGVGAQIEKTLNAQSELSCALLNLLNSPEISGQDKIRELVEEKYLQSCCRESELMATLERIVDLSTSANGKASGEAAKELSLTLRDWMATASTSMHGTAEALALERSPAFTALSEILKELGGADGKVDAAVRTRLQAALTQVEATIVDTLQNKEVADKQFFREALGVLREIQQSMVSTRESVVESVINRHLQTSFGIPPALQFSEKLLEEMKTSFPQITEFLRLYGNINHLAQEFVAAKRADSPDVEACKALERKFNKANNALMRFVVKQPIVQNPIERSRTSALLNEFSVLNDAMARHAQGGKGAMVLSDAAINELVQKGSGAQLTAALNGLHDKFASLSAHWSLIESLVDRCKGLNENDVNTKEVLRSFINREVPISTLIEARVNGIKDEDINPSLCDDNVVNSKAFGKGTINTVYEVTMNDGKHYIFKPEASGRSALPRLSVAMGAYDSTVNISALNIAAHKAAEFLGTGERIVSAQIGIHNGQLGLFMEKAEGHEAKQVVEEQGGKNPTIPNFKKMSNETFLQTNGQLMKQCYDLEWTDFLIGSGDRHGANYLINVDGQNKVVLKGIDNDMSFGIYRSNFASLSLNKERTERFLNLAIDMLHTRAGTNISAPQLLKALQTMEGLRYDEEEGSLHIDLMKLNQPWLREVVLSTTGMHQIVPPMVIDQKMYDRLMAIDNDSNLKNEYCQLLTNRMSAKNVTAALNRLDSAIAHAKELKNQGRVIQQWESASEQRRILDINLANKKTTREDPSTTFGRIHNKLNQYDEEAVRHLSYNLYFRDFLPAMEGRLKALK